MCAGFPAAAVPVTWGNGYGKIAGRAVAAERRGRLHGLSGHRPESGLHDRYWDGAAAVNAADPRIDRTCGGSVAARMPIRTILVRQANLNAYGFVRTIGKRWPVQSHCATVLACRPCRCSGCVFSGTGTALMPEASGWKRSNCRGIRRVPVSLACRSGKNCLRGMRSAVAISC